MNQKTSHPQLVFNPLVLLAIAIVLTALLQWRLPSQVIPPNLAHLFGPILFVGGLSVGFPALIGMLKARTSPNPNQAPTALVLGGIYRYTRNPMYLGMLISYAGLFITFQSLWWLLFIPLLVWLMTIWVIIPEENFLAYKFGADYLQFKTQVRRWI